MTQSNSPFGTDTHYTNKKMFNKAQILKDMIKEIDWNLRLNRKVGSASEMVEANIRGNVSVIIRCLKWYLKNIK